jgi:hypothetical protein
LFNTPPARILQQTRVAKEFSTALLCASNPSASAAKSLHYTEHLSMPRKPALLPDLKRMGCGGCGGGTFTVFTADATARIVLQCEGCNSTSYIQPEPSSLRIEWGDGDGCLSIG